MLVFVMGRMSWNPSPGVLNTSGTAISSEKETGVGAQGMCSEGDVIEGGFSVIFHGTFLDCKKVEVNHLT